MRRMLSKKNYAENDNEDINEGVELLAMLIIEWFT